MKPGMIVGVDSGMRPVGRGSVPDGLLMHHSTLAELAEAIATWRETIGAEEEKSREP